MKPIVMYRRVVVEAGLENVESGKRAAAAVLHALRDRLTRDEGRQAIAQLPRELKQIWGPAATPNRPVKMHKTLFYERVRTEAALVSTRKAKAVTTAVFAALKEQLSQGEVEDIEAQLPKDLKAVWEAA